MARRVYTGPPVTFTDRRVGYLETGEEFDAPEDLLEGLDRRADIAVPPAEADAAVEAAREQAEETTSRRRPGGRRPGGPSAGEQEAASCP